MSLSAMELTPSEIKKGQYYTLGKTKLRSYKPPYLFVEVDNEFVAKTFTIFSKTKYECVRIVRSRFNELRANVKIKQILNIILFLFGLY